MKGLECMERTKIAIADDNQSILEALRSVIDEEDDINGFQVLTFHTN